FDRQIGRDVEVETLALIHVFLADSSLLDDLQLADLFEGLEYLLFMLGESIEMLYTAVMEHDATPGFLCIHAFFHQQFFEVFVLADKVTFGQSGFVVIAAERFDAWRSLTQDG